MWTIPLSVLPKTGKKRAREESHLKFLQTHIPFWRNDSDILDSVSWLNVTQEQNGLLGQMKRQKSISAPWIVGFPNSDLQEEDKNNLGKTC